MSGTVVLADDHLALDFPYDPTQVTEIKQIPGAKWDKIARVWRVPAAATHAVVDFAARHGLDLDPDVARLTVPVSPADGLTMDADWVRIRFTYEPLKVRSVKDLPSVTWEPDTKSWKVPKVNAADAVVWADRFNLAVSDEIRAAAAAVRATSTSSIDASRACDADIKIPGIAPGLALHPYQRAGVAYLNGHRRSFLADDMGLGKTAQAMATVELTGAYPAVVVCPPTLTLNWQVEYHRWFPQRTVAVVTGRKEFPDLDGVDVVVVGWSNISHWADRLTGFDAYIFDESHYAKSDQAQRTKAAVKIAKTAPKAGVVLCLTGTPITNKPAEFAPQLDILGKLKLFGGKQGFYRRYCGAFRDRWGHWHIDGATHLDELNDKLREHCYVRRLKGDVLPQLPPVVHQPVLVEGDPAVMRDYARAEADIVAFLMERARQIAEELGLNPRSAAVRAKMVAESSEHLVRISVLRKIAAKAKMAAVIELVDNHVEAGQKVILAAHHRDIVDTLAERFGGLKIQGQMKVDEVEAHKARFQTLGVAEAPAIVLSIQAAKTGHTLTAAQDVIFVELPWTPSDVDQTYSRAHRLGQQGSVTATYVLCRGTIDETIHDLIGSKRSVVDAATDGGQGGDDTSTAAAMVLSLFDRAR